MILSEKHSLIRQLARQFAETELAPIAAEIDRTGKFPDEILKKMAKLGFFGIRMPQSLGGAGADCLSYAIVMEEIARKSGVASIYISAPNSLVGAPFYIAGTEEQKEKYLRPLIAGDIDIAFCLTEPGAGSDAGAVSTTAVKDGTDYILNGRKTFITAAPMSDYLVVFAKTDKEKGTRGITTFIVDSKAEGVSFGKFEDKMGMIGCPTSDVILENVRVSETEMLGDFNKGFSTAMKTLDLGRIGVAAQSVGLAQSAMDEAVKYAKTRKQFGQPLAKMQGIQFMLADMETKLNAARLLVYQAAEKIDANGRATKEAAMAKYFAAESAVEIASKALQIHGGYGYMKDYPIERIYRDVRVLPIYEGTSQIQQTVIAGQLLK